MLRDVPLAPNFPMRGLAEHARGKSGSDLKELCRNAVMMPVRELIHDANGDVARLAQGQEEGFNLRPLTVDDFYPGASIVVDELCRVEGVEPVD
jgi:SpoVK/Ycf46/Vps4 family AAA+-type ATPase